MIVAAEKLIHEYESLPQVAREEVLVEMLRRAALQPHDLPTDDDLVAMRRPSTSSTCSTCSRFHWAYGNGLSSAFNLFNRGFYGTPDLNIEHSLNSPANFETTLFTGPPSGPVASGAGGGAFPQALGNRNVQLMGKIIF